MLLMSCHVAKLPEGLRPMSIVGVPHWGPVRLQDNDVSLLPLMIPQSIRSWRADSFIPNGLVRASESTYPHLVTVDAVPGAMATVRKRAMVTVMVTRVAGE
jgi:hypothetical protein